MDGDKLFDSCFDFSPFERGGDDNGACGASLTAENDDVDWVQRIFEEAEDEGLPGDDEEHHQQDGADPNHTTNSSHRIPRVRQRARNACIACHKRKVRCDVLNRGRTCTNCRLDGVECVVRSRKTRRPSATTQAHHTDDAVTSPTEEFTSAAVLPGAPPPPPPPQDSELDSCLSLTAEPVEDCTVSSGLESDLALGSLEPILQTDMLSSLAMSQSPPLPSPLPLQRPLSQYQQQAQQHQYQQRAGSFGPFATCSTDANQHNSDTEVMFSYYDFVEAESLSHLDFEDFKFLERKGCFHLPSSPILNELVREYFLHVHPALPILDEGEFWKAYFSSTKGDSDHTQSPPIPLFVFRAMLFVSCSFVSDSTIHQMGFQKSIDARSYMYQRAKLLATFETTTSPIALAQGALLLTYYCSDREPRANTSWLQLAIEQARSINVPGYQHDSSISGPERMLRKRLWWCIILRDRILHLGVRRPIQLTRDQFDFSQPHLTEDDLHHEAAASCVYSRQTKMDLAQVVVAQMDFAVLLTDIIPIIYPTNGLQVFDTLDNDAMLSKVRQLNQYKAALEAWSGTFKRIFPPKKLSKKHKSVSLYMGLTEIYYQQRSVKAALCQYESFMLQAMNEHIREERMKQLSMTLHSSVVNISETIHQFTVLDLVRYIPVSIIAYMALPILLTSLDMKPSASLTSDTCTSGIRATPRGRQLTVLNETMIICCNRYHGGSAAISSVSKTIDAGRCEISPADDSLSHMKSLSRSLSMGDWFAAFISHPISYLRISFILDISISKGRYADVKDLPQRLLLHDSLSLSRGLTIPCLDLDTDRLRQPTEAGELRDRESDVALNLFNIDAISS